MICYSHQSRDQIFVKDYRFLSFAKNMGRNIGKSISQNLRHKYDQKQIDHAKKSVTNALKTASKRAILKTAEATGHFIQNKIPDKIIRVSKTYNSETSEEYISPKERQKIIDDLRLI